MSRHLACWATIALVLVLVTPSWGDTIGNALIDRPIADGAYEINFVDLDLAFATAGVIESWSIYGQAAGTLGLQVFRHDSNNNYLLVGENVVSADGTGLQTFAIDLADRIEVLPDDVIGWRFEGTSLVMGQGVIDYTNGGSSIRHTLFPIDNPDVGDLLSFPRAGSRTYSIAATYAPVPEPASLALIASGLGLLVWRLRRRRG